MFQHLVCYPCFGNAPIFFMLSLKLLVLYVIYSSALEFYLFFVLHPQPHFLEVNSIYETTFLFFHTCVCQITTTLCLSDHHFGTSLLLPKKKKSLEFYSLSECLPNNFPCSVFTSIERKWTLW